MELISDSKEIGKRLSKLFKRYNKYYILTAWATGNNPTFKVLEKNKNRIKQMVVGTQFYQTNPNFMESFIDNSNVKFIIESQQGIYHPKVYLFENNKNDWECLIGSANFTKSALSVNDEIMISFNQDDDNAEEIYSDLREQINTYWNRAQIINEKYLNRYEKLFNKTKKILEKIDNKYTDKKSKKSILESSILSMDWEEYFSKIKDDRHHSFSERLKLLQTAKEYFEQYKSFSEIDKEKRKQIAGTVGKYNPEKSNDKFDWAWFGSMVGAGHFKQTINTNNKFISHALDCIPQMGEIKYQDYLNYIENFKQAFPEGGDGIATATRLLAIKRPDIFVCLDGPNKENLCADFGIKKSLNYEEYWNEIIMRIQDSIWWQSDKPTQEEELQAWQGRVAMMDVIFYEE